MTSRELEAGKLSLSLLFLSTSSTIVLSMKSEKNFKAVDNILFKKILQNICSKHIQI